MRGRPSVIGIVSSWAPTDASPGVVPREASTPPSRRETTPEGIEMEAGGDPAADVPAGDVLPSQKPGMSTACSPLLLGTSGD